MCNEFFLVVSYLVILFILDFFFFNILRTYFKKTIFLVKIKKIFKYFPSKNLNFLIFFYYSEKLEKSIFQQNFFQRLFLLKGEQEKDILILGNCYKKVNKDFDIFLFLLTRQYLFE